MLCLVCLFCLPSSPQGDRNIFWRSGGLPKTRPNFQQRPRGPLLGFQVVIFHLTLVRSHQHQTAKACCSPFSIPAVVAGFRRCGATGITLYNNGPCYIMEQISCGTWHRLSPTGCPYGSRNAYVIQLKPMFCRVVSTVKRQIDQLATKSGEHTKVIVESNLIRTSDWPTQNLMGLFLRWKKNDPIWNGSDLKEVTW